ncbi:Beta-1,6-galactofuranosyltransferase WbbI [Streptococcus sanguinis]|jgi:wefE|uniref:Beta-1,6-galactofuranosyltransferase WbbI n=1 Tax=Streptococcus sanguinis TaxID=1305 RepID=A0A2X3XWP2_STRSA|nr:galactofuranosyltransferase [Streptococcus sanguinis]RSI14986.1 Beta-1,6-galactofuranosyltransferase WbbI [Streptococcus sanguinis]RSI44554.1 Beta-1,6-galactofuranosyltransferase WbbI [Streptococcus sanguinis]RSI52790.1 Beta-1,6-galactofuranosyltransferase WbbI [Streptococcus sanguinis]RSI65938.1 Beta-1,6-galactofuranosyltransferase WbbI [Streptococcus sanguinis]SQF70334.1 glycosyltransferase [Streptococcus sanguinis]
MVKYYLKDSFMHNAHEKNAGNKARDDAEAIFISAGYKGLEPRVENWYEMNFFKAQAHKYAATKAVFDQLSAGDELVIQFPIIHHTFFHAHLIKQAQRRGAKVFFLIHDLAILRDSNHSSVGLRQKIRTFLQEKQVLRAVDGLIVHNDKMKEFLSNHGIQQSNMVSLEIFDYLIPDFQEKEEPSKDSPMIVAGNLMPDKTGYLYCLPQEPDYNLYGLGFESDRALKNQTYFGSFMPDQLLAVLSGSFGLIWDGDSAETCSGVYGNYLRFNNSHKASLYLAAGFPVVVWKESALAHFILEKKCGLAVASLYDLKTELDTLTEEEYKEMLQSARQIGSQLREGRYLKAALAKLK